MTTTIIDDIEYQFEDEELSEVEYLEIVSFEEIIKNNPTFIAFSKENIYNELYSFFKDKAITETYLNLFYDIIEKQKNINDTSNFVIMIDAIREKDVDISNLISKYNSLKYKDWKLSFNEKNKIFFAPNYEDTGKKIKFNATSKTLVKFNYKDDSFYYVYKDDETNLPILGIYFLSPKTTKADYLNEQILSFLNKKEKFDEILYKDQDTFNDLIYEATPDIFLNKLENNEYLDYSNLNNFLQRYNINLDFLNEGHFNELKTTLELFISKEKEEKRIYKPYNFKEIKLTNNKFNFYNYLKKIIKLIEITIGKKDIFNTIRDDLNSQIIADVPLLYNNIEDIVNAINKSIISVEDIIKNLKDVKKDITLKYALTTLKNYKDLNLDEAKQLLDKLENDFEMLKKAFKDIYKIEFNFEKEEHEIKLGNDISNYENIPSSNPIFDDLKEEEGIIFDDDETTKIKNKNEAFEKYYNTNLYKVEEGFIELLKLILPYIAILEMKSGLMINYDILCNNLFNKFREIPTKKFLLTQNFANLGQHLTTVNLNEMSKITPKRILELDDNYDEDVQNIKCLKKYNKEYSQYIINILYHILSWWSIEIQKDILLDNIIFNEQMAYITCLSTWNYYGFPYDIKATDGVLMYLICILEEHLLNTEDQYIILPEKFLNNTKKYLEDNFNEILEKLRKLKPKDDLKKKKDIGRESQKKLVDIISNPKNINKTNLINSYVDALIYMPSLKYKQIHKYLLGCCLQKIDKNYKTDIDLIGVRNDLYQTKNYLSKLNIYKPRIIKFHPTNEDINQTQGKIYNTDHKYMDVDLENNYKLEDWLLSVKGTYLFEDKIIEEFIENPKNAEKYINKYLLLIATTCNKKIAFDINTVYLYNYKSVLYNINSIIYQHLKYNNIDDKIIEFYYNPIKEIIEHLNTLEKIMNDDNKNEILRIINFIIIRSMCIPSNPELSIGKVLKPTLDLNNKAIEQLADELLSYLLKTIKSSKFFDTIEQVEFINKIREENKNKVFSKTNKMNDDQLDLFNKLKNIGYDVNDLNLDEEKNNINEEKNDEEEDENDSEFDMNEEEGDEDDDDDLDRHDRGFIYS